jgi:NADH-quinone oxidoreductase subunit D
MELFERVSGARMHTALYSPFYFDFSVLTPRFWLDCVSFLNRASRALAGAFLGLLHNRALKTRLGGVGQLSSSKLRAYGITGVIARSSGLAVDLRLHPLRPYSSYRALTFRTFVGRRGDNFDRFLLRIKEVIEAFRLVAQAVYTLRSALRGCQPVNALVFSCGAPDVSTFPALLSSHREAGFRAFFRGALGARDLPVDRFLAPASPLVDWGAAPSFSFAAAHGSFSGMEELIAHFRQASEGHLLLPGFAYAAVETPKGELGVALFADGSPRPYRMKVRTPVAHNLHLIPSLGGGVFFADFVASFCSLDVVFGEIDR